MRAGGYIAEHEGENGVCFKEAGKGVRGRGQEKKEAHEEGRGFAGG